MDIKRFSLFDATVWAARSVLDHIRLFIGMLLVALGIFAAWELLLLVIARFTFFWNQIPDMREFLWQFKLAGVLQPRTTELHFPVITWFGVYMVVGALIMGSILALGYAKISIRFYDTAQESSVRDLFCCWRQIGSFIGALLVYVLMITFGLGLLILPGIYLMIRFGFFKYVMVDTGAGLVDSLRKSYQITAGHTWELFGMVLIALLLSSVVFLWPAIELLYVYVYRKLTQKTV
jgi:hypothetical protein